MVAGPGARSPACRFLHLGPFVLFGFSFRPSSVGPAKSALRPAAASRSGGPGPVKIGFSLGVSLGLWRGGCGGAGFGAGQMPLQCGPFDPEVLVAARAAAPVRAGVDAVGACLDCRRLTKLVDETGKLPGLHSSHFCWAEQYKDLNA